MWCTESFKKLIFCSKSVTKLGFGKHIPKGSDLLQLILYEATSVTKISCKIRSCCKILDYLLFILSAVAGFILLLTDIAPVSF